MKRRILLLILIVIVTVLIALPGLLSAGHDDDPKTENIHPMGHDEAEASLFHGPPFDIHTDIAFWDRYAFQGNWTGFRILDISAPGNPKLISFTSCNGNQGDVVIWDNILVRSWNSPAPGDTECGGVLVPAGFEGVHIFDVSDVNAPVLLGAVETDCGSHTATAVPDLDNQRLIIYSNGSGGGCGWTDIIEVPLDDPGSASLIGISPLVNATGCHDMSVLLGDVNLAVCASSPEVNVFDISDPTAPMHLYNITEPGVTVPWHSGAFTWDGEVIVLGWEPGGGVAPSCEEGDPDVFKSFFFYDADNGAKLGQWVLPRPQGPTENCTIHNFNVVPLRNGNYVLAHGSYQSGTSVVDFTDPANPVEVGYSDPPAIDPIDLGGAWSTYWYNNFMYESNITEGLNVFRLSSSVTRGAMRLDHLNPQTQEFTIP
jgi:hypothetical protein